MIKIIWTYWHQGFENAPYIVQKCIERVKEYNPEYEIHTLDNESIYEFADIIPIPVEKWDKLRVQHRSDLLRTQLLINHGGIWMDPTVFVMVPFDNWLSKYLNSGVFFFQNPGPDRIIANWFIAAEKDNYILKKLYKSLINYWNSNDFTNLESDNRKAYFLKRIVNGRSKNLSLLWLTSFVKSKLRIFPYMIYHFMFFKLLKEDVLFRSIWDEMPVLEAKSCLKVKRSGFDTIYSSKDFATLCEESIPLFKLDWKVKFEDLQEDSLLKRLLKF